MVNKDKNIYNVCFVNLNSAYVLYFSHSLGFNFNKYF